MTGSVLAVLSFPDENVGSPSGKLTKLRLWERYKRNPRSPEYMRELGSAMPGSQCKFLELPAGTDPKVVLTSERLKSVEEIILLWPDAIGQGWSPIEHAVFMAKKPAARVSVLTGRQRRFAATLSSLLPFRMRRVVERLWLGEISLAAALLLAAPFLLAWDAIRGRK